MKIGTHIGVCTAIGVAASWHIASTLNNAISQEHQLDMFETANKVLQAPIIVEAGQAIVPTAPGLGIEVDEHFVRAHSAEVWSISFDQNQHNISSST